MSKKDGLIGSQDLESTAPREVKIFRLRTVSGKKMDAFDRDGQVNAPEFEKTEPADEEEDAEEDGLFDFSLVIISFVKLYLLSICIYTFLFFSQAKIVFYL